MAKLSEKTLIIAGPCAAESREQVISAAMEAKKRSVDFLRACLWKPRTKPGFDGVGEKGIDWLIEAAKLGVNPGTEVLTPEHAKLVIDRISEALPGTEILIWIGARNQNHQIQQAIAEVVAPHKHVYLMVKNQPWMSEEHWEGIVAHVLKGGVPKERLIICHRGFIPNGHNPNGYRNVPDHGMSMRLKESTSIQTILDPSHIGGSRDLVMKVAKDAKDVGYDGLIIEVHPDPTNAMTDAKQQLTWALFDELIEAVR